MRKETEMAGLSRHFLVYRIQVSKTACNIRIIKLHNCISTRCISQEYRSSWHFLLLPAISVHGCMEKTKPSPDGEFSSVAYKCDTYAENA